ncbi:MAG: 4-hydroxy-tetrahydrodipicolinate synthase [Sphingobacteriales bacterium]|jgi:4-hydroxy-tetrahydrodipicolinate synthase
MEKFKGTGVAMVTPFNTDESIDFIGLKKLIDHLIDGGVDYLVVLGTTGETATLTKNEKQQVFQAVADANHGRVPLVAGLGGNFTAEVVEAVSNFKIVGYEAILSVSPYYNKPTQEGIYQHYKAVAEASNLPIIMYNVPGRTGSNMLPSTTLRLAQVDNIIGMKEACGNMEQIMAIIKDRPKGFLVISGDDLLTQPIIMAGGDGVISVVGNVAPKIFSNMVRFAMAGNMKSSQINHYKLFDLTNLLFSEGNPGGVKAALKHLGLMEERMRLPLIEVSDNTRSGIINIVKTL